LIILVEEKKFIHKPETIIPDTHDADNWVKVDFERTIHINRLFKKDKLILNDKIKDKLIN